jgi:(p)ppGpp synthase/HD superfamily hydrolase
MNELVERAKALAYRAHAGQVDKAGRPYIENVARVAAAVSDDPEAEAVAWLHDVLEDAPEYGKQVIDLIPASPMWRAILCLTRAKWMTPDMYYHEIRTSYLARKVKLADIADNSDEFRLALLDEKTANRLRRKYKKALEALK